MAESFIGQSFQYLKTSIWGDSEILPLSKEGKDTLLLHIDYYKKLSSTLKPVFESEVTRFMKSKQFVDVRNNKQVSMKKKVLIAAKAAQLTFGFHHLDFNFYKTIIVYPKEFYGQDNELKTWELNEDGEMKLSWKHFFKGIKLHNEIDMGLQLMANVLKNESEKAGWLDWLRIMTPQTVETHYYHHELDYREVNPLFSKKDLGSQEDFFVACVINFFNNPMIFKNKYPKLYRNIDLLLHSGFIRNAI